MVTPAVRTGTEPARRAFAFWGGRTKARPVNEETNPALPFEITPRLWAFIYDEDRSAWRDSAHRHTLTDRWDVT